MKWHGEVPLNQHGKGYAGTMYLYLAQYEPKVTYPKINAPEPMDDEGKNHYP